MLIQALQLACLLELGLVYESISPPQPPPQLMQPGGDLERDCKNLGDGCDSSSPVGGA
jgi:hypothetical protein